MNKIPKECRRNIPSIDRISNKEHWRKTPSVQQYLTLPYLINEILSESFFLHDEKLNDLRFTKQSQTLVCVFMKQTKQKNHPNSGLFSRGKRFLAKQ